MAIAKKNSLIPKFKHVVAYNLSLTQLLLNLANANCPVDPKKYTL